MMTHSSSNPEEEYVVDRAQYRIRTTTGPLDYAEGMEQVTAATLDLLESMGIIVDTVMPEVK